MEESSGDDDDDDSSDFLATESCRELRELSQAFSDGDDDDDTLATREREFDRSEGAQFLRLGSEVEVKGGEFDLSAGQEAALRLLTQSAVLEQCFADAMESSLASADEDTPPLELTRVELIQIDPVLPDSLAFVVIIVGLDFEFTLQLHQIPRGRVLGELQVIGAGSTDLTDNLEDIARKFESRILAAQEDA